MFGCGEFEDSKYIRSTTPSPTEEHMELNRFTSLVGRLHEEFTDSKLPATSYFQWAIAKQNEIYELPVNPEPTLLEDDLGEKPLKRVQGFLKTLDKEIQEGKEIEFALQHRQSFQETNLEIDDNEYWSYNAINVAAQGSMDEKRAEAIALVLSRAWDEGGMDEVECQILVMLADWFGDINVYVRSEALKFGLPHESNLAVIMGSNFTKLGEDGAPIKDGNGKFLKGPNYIAPEAALYENMFASIELVEELDAHMQTAARISMVQEVLEDPMGDVLNANEEAEAMSLGDEDYTDADETDEQEGDEQ
jgi:hypothetical protein